MKWVVTLFFLLGVFRADAVPVFTETWETCAGGVSLTTCRSDWDFAQTLNGTATIQTNWGSNALWFYNNERANATYTGASFGNVSFSVRTTLVSDANYVGIIMCASLTRTAILYPDTGYFLFVQNQTWGIQRTIGGTGADLGSGAVTYSIGDIDLMAVRTDTHLLFYVDGNLVASPADTNIMTGYIGLMGYQNKSYYDDLLVADFTVAPTASAYGSTSLIDLVYPRRVPVWFPRR